MNEKKAKEIDEEKSSKSSIPVRDFRPTEKDKRKLRDFFEWDKRSSESLDDCIVGKPVNKPF
jgi:hypothetical protein